MIRLVPGREIGHSECGFGPRLLQRKTRFSQPQGKGHPEFQAKHMMEEYG
jgi:hypothetical protein